MSTAVEPRRRLRDALTAIKSDDAMNDAMLAMSERSGEFDSPMAAKLAGVALNPLARRHFNAAMNAMWIADTEKSVSDRDEIVIGAGLHAAVYCAVRARKGFPRPLVLEASDRIGGIFAMSDEPSFYLNSRNRPGRLSVPGRPGALNVLPGAMVQPSDLSGDEYQRNSDMAYSIRTTLAMCADARTGAKVTRVEPIDTPGWRYRVELEDGRNVRCNRVIIATGLGNARRGNEAPVMTFPQFMATMDNAFPLRGMRSVAIVGAGDSGRTAIEALTGQGPSSRMSVASMDWPTSIDWYGVKPEALTREGWEQCNRSRYRGIGRLLPRTDGDDTARVRPLTERATTIASGWEEGYVNERPYDAVIVCTGFEPAPYPFSDGAPWTEAMVGGRAVGLSRGEVFVIGPAAGLQTSATEKKSLLAEVPENSTSLFRYAGRTASLANSLAAAEPPVGISSVAETGSMKERRVRVKRDPRLPRNSSIKIDRSVGTDRDGAPLFVGDRVEVLGSFKQAVESRGTGTIIGPIEGARVPCIGVDITEGPDTGNGGFQINGAKVWGVIPGLCVKIERESVGVDLNGTPLYLDDMVDVRGDGETARGSSFGRGPIVGVDELPSGVKCLLVEIQDGRYKDYGGGRGPNGKAWRVIANLTVKLDTGTDASEIGTDKSDKFGNPLYVGDRVRITGSDRFGSVEARVKPNQLPGNRVSVEVDLSTATKRVVDFDGKYRPSLERVERL